MPAMPTMVCFSGVGGDAITVEESPEQILDVLKDRQGIAVLLTLNGVHAGVYINAERIACWYPSRPKGEPQLVPRPFIGPI
jgi:hypothetical protein